jgi:hypothetical protein
MSENFLDKESNSSSNLIDIPQDYFSNNDNCNELNYAKLLDESNDEFNLDFLNLDDDSKTKLEMKLKIRYKLTETDTRYLQSTPLFNFWDETTFSNFIKENKITCKKIK